MTIPVYQLLLLDIDGTLLDDHSQITPRTRRAVAAAQAAGVVVALATARRHFSASLFAADLDLTGPVVSYDGALIQMYPSCERWHSDLLPASIGQAAVDTMARHGLQPLAQYNQDNREQVLTGPTSNDTPWIGNYYDLYAAQFERHALAELCVGKGDPLRVVAFGPLERLEQIAVELQPLPCQLYLNPQGSYGSAELSVISPTASKGNALSILSSRLRLAHSQSMALGDSFNDLSMLRLAGLGVAMGQAPPAVQAVAKVVTLPNTEDGAALAIERYLLNGKRPEE